MGPLTVIDQNQRRLSGPPPRLLPSVLPAAKPGSLLHLPPAGCPVPLPHSIALDGENGDENRGQRDGDNCEDGIAAHASVRPSADRQKSARLLAQLVSM